jgi:hypothetical protein
MFLYFPKHWGGVHKFLKLTSTNLTVIVQVLVVWFLFLFFFPPPRQVVADVATVIITDIIIIITFISNFTISTQQQCLSSILADFCPSVLPPQTQFPSILKFESSFV